MMQKREKKQKRGTFSLGRVRPNFALRGSLSSPLKSVPLCSDKTLHFSVWLTPPSLPFETYWSCGSGSSRVSSSRLNSSNSSLFRHDSSYQERQSSKEGSSKPCSFRISSQGLRVILPYITKQILYTPMADFKHLLEQKSIKFPGFINPQVAQKATDLDVGSLVIPSDGEEPVKVDASTIAISCWRGTNSLAVMVTAADCQELLERLAEKTPKTKGGSVNESNGDSGGPQAMETA